MTILAQSFFTLVRCHLVAFTFLSVGHSRKILSLYIECEKDRSKTVSIHWDYFT